MFFIARPSCISTALCCFALCAVVAPLESLAACPFCPPSSPPLAFQLADAEFGLLVQWVSAKSTDDATDANSSTTFEVVDRLKGGRFALKERVVVPFLQEGQPGDWFLLLGSANGDAVDWQPLQEMNEVSYAYLKRAPAPEVASPDRLPYFAKHLEHRDQVVSADAFAEFSRAAFSEVQSAQSHFQREKLRDWMTSTDLAMQPRKSFYGMLLGMIGDPRDVAYLSSIVLLDPQPDQIRIEIDGVMGGYLLARGAAGLVELERGKLDAASRHDGEMIGLINAIRFIADFAPERVPRDDLLRVMRRLIDVPSMAEIVLPDLARWKDWSLIDRLAAAYGEPPFDRSFGKDKVIAYLRACEKDVGPDSTKPSETSQRAKAALAALAERDPDQFRERPRSLFGR